MYHLDYSLLGGAFTDVLAVLVEGLNAAAYHSTGAIAKVQGRQYYNWGYVNSQYYRATALDSQ
jgi:hypothetical protein